MFVIIIVIQPKRRLNMELIIINDKKLKIMLTENDLAEFSLNADNLDYSNADTKKMFWDITPWLLYHSIRFCQ